MPTFPQQHIQPHAPTPPSNENEASFYADTNDGFNNKDNYKLDQRWRKKTKQLATLGPASSSFEMIEKLLYVFPGLDTCWWFAIHNR
jgi:hypothetical protein